MGTSLRIEMIILSILIFLIIIRGIRKNGVMIQYAILWLGIAVVMIFIGLVPKSMSALSRLFHIQYSSNLVFLLGIIALLLLNFQQTVIVSRQSQQIAHLVQNVSINQYCIENHLNSREEDLQKEDKVPAETGV
jgi:hypothetical protein